MECLLIKQPSLLAIIRTSSFVISAIWRKNLPRADVIFGHVLRGLCYYDDNYHVIMAAFRMMRSAAAHASAISRRHLPRESLRLLTKPTVGFRCHVSFVRARLDGGLPCDRSGPDRPGSLDACRTDDDVFIERCNARRTLWAESLKLNLVKSFAC